jgi:inosine-uridine nucleoside N-ribohydrolase
MKSLTRSFFVRVLLVASLAVIQVSYADNLSTETPWTDTRELSAPVNIIFDTDMWSDIDDALALAMLHALHDRHEINLVAVTVSTGEKWCASYVDLIDTFYGHPKVPIGIVRDGLDIEAFRKKYPTVTWPVTRYTELLSEEKRNGSLVYPHRFLDGTKAPEAVALLRKTLAGQPDGSVVVIQVGYSTNLARLLETVADATSALSGPDLIRKKVRLLSVMAGNFADSRVAGKAFPKGSPEFNLATDVPSAQKVFSSWPTPIVVSGFEIGIAMLYPAVSIERDFSYVKDHPIAETYRTYAEEQKVPKKWPHDHPTFDLTSVLYAARPDRNYFSLSNPGTTAVLADGSSRFDESPDGTQRYLILSEEQKARTLEAMVMLVSQPPRK